MPKAAATKSRSDAPEKKAKRTKKDPNAPKRALSAYMFFVNSQRQNVIDSNPGIKFGEVGKVLGQQWGQLTEDQKKPYNKQAEADKVRAAKEAEAYKSGGGAKAAAPAKKPASKAKKEEAPVEEDDDDEEESD